MSILPWTHLLTTFSLCNLHCRGDVEGVFDFPPHPFTVPVAILWLQELLLLLFTAWFCLLCFLNISFPLLNSTIAPYCYDGLRSGTIFDAGLQDNAMAPASSAAGMPNSAQTFPTGPFQTCIVSVISTSNIMHLICQMAQGAEAKHLFVDLPLHLHSRSILIIA